MKNKFLCIIFVLLLGASFVVWALPADKASFEKENREPATLPELNAKTLKNGTFMTDFESYVNDSVGFRSCFTSFSTMLEGNFGIQPPDGKVIYTNKDIGTATVKKACLLLLEDKVMEAFSADEKQEKVYADTVNIYEENTADDINVYSMIIPTQLQFQIPLYKNIQSDQKETIDYIYSMENENVRKVDAYSELEKHSDEYIYFRTDHHWTMLGAYYAYTAFAKEAGFEPVSLDNFEKTKVEEGFLGYLYNQVEDKNLQKYKDHVEWFNIDDFYDLSYEFLSFDKNGNATPYNATMLDRTATNYSFFFISDHPYAKIHNNTVTNGKTILVIKDSYANAFTPWLVNDYENVIMIDPRSFKGNISDVITNDNVTDILMMHYVFTTTFDDYCELMVDMWTN